MKRILVVDSDMAVRSQAMAILRSPSAGRMPLIL